MAKKGKNKEARLKAPKMSKTADRYALYLQSVQAPDVDAAFFSKVYKKEFGQPAKTLREDFCGTFAVCCEWAKRGDDMVAYGVDLDPEPLAWGAPTADGKQAAPNRSSLPSQSWSMPSPHCVGRGASLHFSSPSGLMVASPSSQSRPPQAASR